MMPIVKTSWNDSELCASGIDSSLQAQLMTGKAASQLEARIDNCS